VDSLFDWHVKELERSTFTAPYFPLVQSSGMGKTKLMVEYKRSVDRENGIETAATDRHCELLLCKLDSRKTESYWDCELDCFAASDDGCVEATSKFL